MRCVIYTRRHPENEKQNIQLHTAQIIEPTSRAPGKSRILSATDAFHLASATSPTSSIVVMSKVVRSMLPLIIHFALH